MITPESAFIGLGVGILLVFSIGLVLANTVYKLFFEPNIQLNDSKNFNHKKFNRNGEFKKNHHKHPKHKKSNKSNTSGNDSANTNKSEVHKSTPRRSSHYIPHGTRSFAPRNGKPMSFAPRKKR